MKKVFFITPIMLLLVVVFIGFNYLTTCAQAAVKFDAKKINSANHAGYLDKVTVTPPNPKQQGSVFLRGWAQDLKLQKPAQELVVLSDGKAVTVPIKTGLKREDVAKTFKNNNLTYTGYESTFPAKILGKGKHKLEIYALQSDGSFAPLRHKDNNYVEIILK
jgi:hypothetical protein